MQREVTTNTTPGTPIRFPELLEAGSEPEVELVPIVEFRAAEAAVVLFEAGAAAAEDEERVPVEEEDGDCKITGDEVSNTITAA